MQTMIALCVLFCGPPGTGRVVVKAAVRSPVTAQTFQVAAWEAVEWDTYRVIRVDTRDEHGYLALTPPQNTDAFMFSVRSVSFPGRGRVLLEAVGITEPSLEISVSGNGWAFNGDGAIVCSITITQRGHVVDRWPSAVLLARQGSALEDVAAVARRGREQIEKQKAKDKETMPSQGR